MSRVDPSKLQRKAALETDRFINGVGAKNLAAAAHIVGGVGAYFDFALAIGAMQFLQKRPEKARTAMREAGEAFLAAHGSPGPDQPWIMVEVPAAAVPDLKASLASARLRRVSRPMQAEAVFVGQADPARLSDAVAAVGGAIRVGARPPEVIEVPATGDPLVEEQMIEGGVVEGTGEANAAAGLVPKPAPDRTPPPTDPAPAAVEVPATMADAGSEAEPPAALTAPDAEPAPIVLPEASSATSAAHTQAAAPSPETDGLASGADIVLPDAPTPTATKLDKAAPAGAAPDRGPPAPPPTGFARLMAAQGRTEAAR